MNNYKIRVNNEAESREAQELFFELGFEWKYKDIGKRIYIDDSVGFLYADRDCITTGEKDDGLRYFEVQSNKEITLPELRELVVLKRNSIEDATHTTTDDVWKFYIGHDTYCYERKNGVVGWHKEDSKCYVLKPIEKKEMKEYLVKNKHGEYVLLNNVSCIPSEFVIEVPEGAGVALSGGGGSFYFYKNNDSYFNGLEWRKCDVDSIKTVSAYVDTGATILWQRHEQPEELTFIDDEPKPDTPMAYMEREFERDQCMENARREGLLGDPRIGAPHNPCDEPRIDTYKSEFGVEPPISLNNQYAEIEKVRQDNVNHPSHYTNGKVECIDALESATVGKKGIEAVCVANVIKYLWRYEDKNGVEDIKKAKWYLEKLINTLE